MTKDVLHDQYLAKLEVPTKEKIASIAKIQEEREKEIDSKYHRPDEDGPEHEKEEAAAGAIQVLQMPALAEVLVPLSLIANQFWL